MPTHIYEDEFLVLRAYRKDRVLVVIKGEMTFF